MSTNKHSPDLLKRRPLTGIAIHLLSLLTGIIGAGLVYLLAKNEFTRENARHALNWHLTVSGLTVAALVSLLLGFGEFDGPGGTTIEIVTLPDPLALVFILVGFVLTFAMVLVSFMSMVFPFIATGKAIFGKAWKYPFAREFVTGDA